MTERPQTGILSPKSGSPLKYVREISDELVRENRALGLVFTADHALDRLASRVAGGNLFLRRGGNLKALRPAGLFGLDQGGSRQCGAFYLCGLPIRRYDVR